MEAINFIINHSVEILAIIGGVLSISKAIAKLTPTGKDDEVIEKIRKVFEKISDLFLPDIKRK